MPSSVDIVNHTVTAITNHFTKFGLLAPIPVTASLTVKKQGIGTVTGDGIECGEMCSKTYEIGSIITLAAEAAPGFVFDGWSVASCGIVSECMIKVNADVTITARFVSSIGSGTDPDPASPVPEPTTLLFYATGLIGILIFGMKKFRNI